MAYFHAFFGLLIHMAADTQNTDPLNLIRSLKIPVNPPYLKPPKSVLNDLNLPIKNYYTTQDLCKVLNIKPNTFRYRIRTGNYPEPKKVGGKRRFTEMEIQEILETTESLNS